MSSDIIDTETQDLNSWEVPFTSQEPTPDLNLADDGQGHGLQYSIPHTEAAA